MAEVEILKSRCYTNVEIDAFLLEPSCHSHAPDPNRFRVIRIQNGIKERSVPSKEGTIIILHNVLRTAPLSIAADLPSTEATSYNFEFVSDYLARVAANGKLNS